MSDLQAIRRSAAERAAKYTLAADKAAAALTRAKADLKAARDTRQPQALIDALDDSAQLAQTYLLQLQQLARCYENLAAGRRAFA